MSANRSTPRCDFLFVFNNNQSNSTTVQSSGLFVLFLIEWTTLSAECAWCRLCGRLVLGLLYFGRGLRCGSDALHHCTRSFFPRAVKTFTRKGLYTLSVPDWLPLRRSNCARVSAPSFFNLFRLCMASVRVPLKRFVFFFCLVCADPWAGGNMGVILFFCGQGHGRSMGGARAAPKVENVRQQRADGAAASGCMGSLSGESGLFWWRILFW